MSIGPSMFGRACKWNSLKTRRPYLAIRHVLLGLAVVTVFTFTRVVYFVRPRQSLATSECESGCCEQMVLPLCPVVPPGLVGNITIDVSVPTWDDLEGMRSELHPGGRWTPRDCTARHRLAVIVPYRDRERNLKLFLQHMHPFLQKQNVEYGIYVSEQYGTTTFNRGLARNVGFVEALKLDQFDCVIFHDVDLLPINDRNMYIGPDVPRHMCAGVDYLQYTPLYRVKAYFGGVVSMLNEQFKQINGYSNLYFGWGAEDDDLYVRFSAKGIRPYQYPVSLGKYNGMSHVQMSDVNTKRFSLLGSASDRMLADGLNSLDYTLLAGIRQPMFTHFTFAVNESLYKDQAEKVISATTEVDAEKILTKWISDLINP